MHRLWLNEKRLVLMVNDELSERLGTIILRRGTQGSQQIMTVTISWSSRVYNSNFEGVADAPGLPSGDFVLIKQ